MFLTTVNKVGVIWLYKIDNVKIIMDNLFNSKNLNALKIKKILINKKKICISC